MARTRKSRSATTTRRAANAADAASKTFENRATERRLELQALRAELAHHNAEQARAAERDTVRRWLDPAQETDVRAFIASRSAQRQQRQYQLSLISDFVADPSRFGLDPGEIPTSTSLEEFAERRGELQYRIAVIKSFLDILNEELRQLDQAEAYAKRGR